MSGTVPGFHVTGNIKTIEKLKSELLSGVSDLHKHLVNTGESQSERCALLADIVISAYALTNRLGIPYTTLDEQISSRLRLRMLDEKYPLQEDAARLLKHMEGKK